MPDYLSKKDWRSVLDKKEHKSVKKTGVSEVLDVWASAAKKDDLGRMVSALERIIEKAGEVKSAQKAYPLLVDFLGKMIDAAKAEERKLAPRLAQLAEDEDEDGDDSDFGKALRKIRQLAEDKAWNFVIVPGKPSSGFVVSKKSIKKSHMDKAFEMKGKRGPFFTGRIFGEGGKYVLNLGDTPPVPGLAKAAKNAALLHAEMTIKVLVRGGGVELDGDTDIEPAEDDTGLFAPRPSPQATPEQFHDQRIAQLKQAVDRIAQTPGGTQEGAMDGIFGAASRIRSQIEGDGALDGNQSKLLLAKLASVLTAANEVTRRGQPDPTKAYPDDAFWEKAAEQIVRLDETKHDDAWKRYMARLDENIERLKKDTALSDSQRAQVEDVLDRAMKRAGNALQLATRMQTAEIEQDTKKTDPALHKRLMSLDRKVETIQRANLPKDRTDRAFQAVQALRRAFSEEKLDLVRGSIDRVEQVIDLLLKDALKSIQTARSREDQAEMHQNLQPAMAFIKKATFPPSLIVDPNSVREAVKKDPKLLALIQAGSAVSKSLDSGTVAALEKAARDMLQAVDQRKGQGTPLPSDAESARMATEALKRAEMARMALRYESLGNPPWDDDKADAAAELQAQLFFLESSISQGNPNYAAPGLKPGTGGASGSWWIERSEPSRSGAPGQTSNEYIFKPGSREASVLSGLPPGSGAPREVLAKKLDDMMSGAGFDIGVTPTTLASLDGAQLGINPKTDKPLQGPQLGSMQKLAPSDGQLGDRIAKGDTKLAASVDKGSFDNVAVFDMVFANLDRHSNNLLVREDKATGKTGLVPIDHGSALAEPEALLANRSSLLPPFNVMADPIMPQSQEPLGPDALEALGRLDPDEMVRMMKSTRDGIEQRHDGAKGMVSDAALDAMAARLRFIKEVGGSVPVATLFEMLAYGAERIAAAKPGDVKQLAQTLIAEAQTRKDAKGSIKQSVDAYEAIGVAKWSALVDDLKELGWGWSQDKMVLDQWCQDNAPFVERILKTRQVNPAVAQEIQRLLVELRKVDPNIDKSIANLPPGAQIAELTSKANEAYTRSPGPRKMTFDQARQEFESLGGEAELKKAGAVIPSAVPGKTWPEDDTDDYAKFDYWEERMLLLRQWKAFNDAGGIREYLRLGGQIVRDQRLQDALTALQDMKSSEKARADLMAKSPDQVDQEMRAAYAREMKDTLERINILRNPQEKVTRTQERQTAENAWTGGKLTEALTRLAYLRRKLDEEIAGQAKFAVDAQREWDKLVDSVKTEGQKAQDDFAREKGRLEKRIETAIATFDRNIARIAMNEARFVLSNAKEGDDAPYNKMVKLREKLRADLNGHAGKPWHPDLKHALDDWSARIDQFDSGFAVDEGARMLDRFATADKLGQWLGNRDPKAMPQEVQDMLVLWYDRIRQWSNLQKLDSDIVVMDNLLNATV